jgi:hypothetical protein
MACGKNRVEPRRGEKTDRAPKGRDTRPGVEIAEGDFSNRKYNRLSSGEAAGLYFIASRSSSSFDPKN